MELSKKDFDSIIAWVDENYATESHNSWDFAFKAAQWAMECERMKYVEMQKKFEELDFRMRGLEK